MTQSAHLLRSVLYMPGSNARAIAKARTLPSDAVVLDLEDAVAPERKEEARATIRTELAAGGFGPRYRVVRINGLDSPWGHEDLAAMAVAQCDAILVPKVDGPGDIRAIAAAMKAAGYPDGTRLWVMIETPAAVLHLGAIAACARSTPLSAFVLGLNDLAKDTGIAQLPGRAALQPVLTMSVMAGRAHGIAVLDGVLNALDDEERLRAECQQARDGGMDGKTLIHPRQVEITNTVFAPTPAEIAQAEAVVAAFADPENAGKGALRVDGRMVERLHLKEAETLLARAAAIAAREKDMARPTA